MRTSQALFIVSSLAEGFDPATGEILPSQSFIQRAEVTDALAKAAKALENLKRAEERRKNRPSKSGTPWTPEEDSALLESFTSGLSVKQLAKKHQRTQWAITSRLISHGKIEQ